MIKPNKTVLKETLYITAWTVIFSLVTEAVFLIVGKWELTVLFGNLLGAAVSVLNFFFMGLTVQKAVELEEKKAALTIKVSQIARTFAMFVIAGAGVLLEYFNPITVLIPLFFPRIAVAFRPLFKKK